MTTEGYRDIDYREQAARLQQENDELRAEVEDLRAENAQLRARSSFPSRPRSEVSCAKCGRWGILTNYQPATPEQRGWFGRLKAPARPERIECRCIWCHYEWVETVVALPTG